MSEDIEYLANYRPNQLYTHPGKVDAHAMVGDNETLLVGLGHGDGPEITRK